MKLAEIKQQKYVMLGDGYVMELVKTYESGSKTWAIKRMFDEGTIGEATQIVPSGPSAGMMTVNIVGKKTGNEQNPRAMDLPYFTYWVKKQLKDIGAVTEAKITKKGALLKNGFYLERDPEQTEGLRSWGIKRMLVPDDLGEAAIFNKTVGDGYIFKITSYQGAGSATQSLSSPPGTEEQLLQRFYSWVEEYLNDPEMGWENEAE